MRNHFIYLLSVWLIVGFTFLVCTSAFSQANKTESAGTVETTADGSSQVSGITTGRARALVGAVAGLICLGVGWRAKIRSSAGNNNVRIGAMVALVLGLIGIVLSVVHLSTSAGAVFGSGSGKAGAIVALVLNLIGMTLGWLALRQRNERSANGN